MENNDVRDFLLFMLIFSFHFEHEMSWNDFEHEVVFKNRHFPKHKILEYVEQKSKKATKKLRKGKVLFRARIHEYNFHEELAEQVGKLDHLNDDEKENIVKEFTGLTKNGEFVSLLLSGALFKNEEQMQTYLKSKEDNLFKGYDKKNSTAPPANMATEGRANPQFVRYLYVAENCKTAIYEVRPIIKQNVSVAPMVVKKTLKLYDFTKSIEDSNLAEINKDNLFNVIGKAFAKPNHNNNEMYIPTQYLTEYIKSLGFDGIRYNSSLHRNGKNIVIFDPDLCEPISSDIYKIENIEVKLKKITS